MPRIPPVTRDQVPPEYLAGFDEETTESGGVLDYGPGSVMFNSPEMRRRANHLADYLRDGSSTPKKLRELAMLIAARSMDCGFIWYAHAPRGRSEGLSAELVDALRTKAPLPPVPPDEETLANYGREFFDTHRVSQPTFQAAIDQFGVRLLTELTTLMGYYAMLAFNVNAFEVDPRKEPDEPELLF